MRLQGKSSSGHWDGRQRVGGFGEDTVASPVDGVSVWHRTANWRCQRRPQRRPQRRMQKRLRRRMRRRPQWSGAFEPQSNLRVVSEGFLRGFWGKHCTRNQRETHLTWGQTLEQKPAKLKLGMSSELSKILLFVGCIEVVPPLRHLRFCECLPSQVGEIISFHSKHEFSI